MTAEHIHDEIYAMGKAARQAALQLAVLTADQKNGILMAMANALRE